MNKIRSYFTEWLQNKTPFMNFRMWNYQISFINYILPIKKKIKINNPRTTFNFSLPPHVIFNIL